MKLQYLCYCIWTCKMHTNPPKCRNGRLLDMIWRRLCILFGTTRREDDAIQKQKWDGEIVRLCHVHISCCAAPLLWRGLIDKWNTFPFKSLLHPWTPSNGANINNGHLDTHPNYCKHCEAPILGRVHKIRWWCMKLCLQCGWSLIPNHVALLSSRRFA